MAMSLVTVSRKNAVLQELKFDHSIISGQYEYTFTLKSICAQYYYLNFWGTENGLHLQ